MVKHEVTGLIAWRQSEFSIIPWIGGQSEIRSAWLEIGVHTSVTGNKGYFMTGRLNQIPFVIRHSFQSADYSSFGLSRPHAFMYIGFKDRMGSDFYKQVNALVQEITNRTTELDRSPQIIPPVISVQLLSRCNFPGYCRDKFDASIHTYNFTQLVQELILDGFHYLAVKRIIQIQHSARNPIIAQ